MAQVLIALGSNLGDRFRALQTAVEAMARHFYLEQLSPVYETKPAYVLDQPKFLNCACRVTTEKAPKQVLTLLQGIEQQLGRYPAQRYGPRLIDLDILFYDQLVLDQPDLRIPHPLLRERAFVLVPLGDIVPDWIHPETGEKIATLRDHCADLDSTIKPYPQLLDFPAP
ncbi:MAG: 2-amino-4-hydroxy-6-hydroxymethyldihydropteridine diphosphokinase [Synechococcaceae cyanobacterium SM2_3_1]|nr:2-amino-4-hydroxy-6-hydroxymethyldihydropteridine diphosphokinase [Synechococcaceae cyanobacterium SM2_3_1]